MGTADIGFLQPSLYASIRAADLSDDASLQIDFAWRFAALFGDTSVFRATNPYLGARIAVMGGEAESRWRARGGLGLTLPLTNLYDPDIAGSIAQALVSPMHGVNDLWLGSAQNMALVGRGDFEYRHTYFVVGGDAALAALFPVEYRGMTGDTSVDLQLGVFVGGRPIPELVLGARFSAVALIVTNTRPGSSNTEGFTSLTPFVRGEIGPAFVEGRLVMNLDEPFGWSFDSGASGLALLHVWSVQVSGGASF